MGMVKRCLGPEATAQLHSVRPTTVIFIHINVILVSLMMM